MTDTDTTDRSESEHPDRTPYRPPEFPEDETNV